MRFLGLAPGLAWGLLAGVAALVVLFYLLKPAPRRLRVASNLVWQRLLKERRRTPERWRWWLSLLLALTIALSIAVALTQPEVAVVSGKAQDVILVIDDSATMGAHLADGRTRLALAIERAEQMINQAGAGSRFLIADTMRQSGVPAFEAKEAALARLQHLAVVPAGRPRFPDVAHGPPPQADASQRRREVYLISDGVARFGVPDHVRFVSVLRPADNVGITAFEVRALPADARRYQAFVQITNASPGKKKAELTLTGVGAAPIKRSVQLDGGAAAGVVVDVSTFGEGPLRVSVSAEQDALALDDAAYAYLPSKSRVRLALVTPGNPALLQTLRLMPRVDVDVVPPARANEAGRYDAAIFDRLAPDRAPLVPALVIAPPSRAWLPHPGAALGETHLARWDSTHPLIEGVALRDVLIEHAQVRKPVATTGVPAFAAVAFGPHDEPLMLATREGRRLALIGFALEASNFAQQPSFPAFLANAVNWLTHEPRAQTQSIGPVSVPPNARVLDLEGKEVATRQIPEASVFDAPTPALYTAVTRDQRVRVSVNLLDPAITRINDGRHASEAAAAEAAAPRLSVDPWLLLLVAAALLLGLEWWTYNRRVTV